MAETQSMAAMKRRIGSLEDRVDKLEKHAEPDAPPPPVELYNGMTRGETDARSA